jgi:hypothetical protein
VSCWGNRRQRDHCGDLGLDGWIILGWICGERGLYSVLLGKPEGKRPHWRRRRRWVDNIRMDLWSESGNRFFVGNPVGKRPLGKPTRRWVYNIRMYL